MTNPTPEDILANLKANPHPKQTHLEMAGGFAYITINGHKIAYNGERWFACGQQITPQFGMNSLHQEIDRVFGLAQKIKAHVLNKTTTPTWEQIKADCVGPDLPIVEQKEQTTMTTKRNKVFVSIDRYRELEAELAKSKDQLYWLSLIGGLYGLSVSNPSKIREEVCRTYNRVSSAETHVDSLRSQLKTMTTSRDATQERVEALQQLLPLFCLGVNAPTDKAREKIESLYSRVKELGLLANDLTDKLKTVTEERDKYKASYDYAQNGLHEVWNATGWLEKADNEPCGIEYLKRLKSKADRAGLLSVVCRRLCGDENATPETVHKALNRVDDESKALDFIGEKVGSVPFHLGEVQSLVAQTVKSLGEKTVEVAKLQEGIKNYEAQLKGYAANKRLQILDRITKILRDAEIATVYDYDDNRAIETDEQVRILCERLNRFIVLKRDVLTTAQTIKDEIRQAHITLNDLNAARCMGTIDLSLPARIRSLFTTKV